MKYYFLLFFFLLSHISFSQTTSLTDTTYFVISDFGEKINFQIKDFNQDGYLDTLSYYYSGGSGFGGRNAKIINGKNGDSIDVSIASSFSSFVNQWIPPNELLQPENLWFRNVLENNILPPKKQAPDQSLKWIISAAHHQKQLSTHPYFNKIISPKIQWSNQPNEAPSTYRVSMRSDSLDQVTHQKSVGTYKTGWLLYYGHNHFRTDKDDWILVGEFEKYKIYKTQHGIVATKGDSSKWVFVTELNLTGAPQKLRWASIRQVEFLDGFLVVQLATGIGEENKIFIVEIESGLVGEMVFKASSGEVFEITQEVKMKVLFEGIKKKIDVESVFKALLKFK